MRCVCVRCQGARHPPGAGSQVVRAPTGTECAPVWRALKPLMLKPSDNPPIMPPWAASITDCQGQWWVGQTKSRNEKAAAWDLLARRIGYFLPMVEKVTLSGGRKRQVLMPLFPSYIFVCGDADSRYSAMTTDRFSKTLAVVDQDGLRGELMSIEKALKGQATLDPFPFAAQGRRCRVAQGPFEGLEGVVVQRRQLARLVLQVGILGQGAAIEIDASLLEPLD